jgi:hypothetical protein
MLLPSVLAVRPHPSTPPRGLPPQRNIHGDLWTLKNYAPIPRIYDRKACSLFEVRTVVDYCKVKSNA